MKQIAIFLGLLFLTTTASIHAGNCITTPAKFCEEGQVYKLPGSVDEFLQLREKIGKTPWGGAELFLMSLLVRDKNKDLGNQLLVLSLHESLLGKSTVGIYKGYSWDRSTDYFMKQIDKHAYCNSGHVKGATPENGYSYSPDKVQFVFRKQQRFVGSIDSGSYKVFACTSGAATCRPLSMRRNKKGFWKVKGFSTIAVGCILPKKTGPSAADDL